MAVYTKISKENLISFLNNYEIGNLEDFEGILEGVENTNYKLTTTEGKFILTIFEKRVNQEELPFFVDLQKYLSSFWFGEHFLDGFHMMMYGLPRGVNKSIKTIRFETKRLSISSRWVMP